MHLRLPEEMRGLQTWDIRKPPLLEECDMFLGRAGQSAQFWTIDIHNTTGITLFLEYGMIFAIHGHTLTMPCAKTTFERFSRGHQRSVTWVYIPIPAGEQIIGLAVPSRNIKGISKPCFLVVASIPLGGNPVFSFQSALDPNKARWYRYGWVL